MSIIKDQYLLIMNWHYIIQQYTTGHCDVSFPNRKMVSDIWMPLYISYIIHTRPATVLFLLSFIYILTICAVSRGSSVVWLLQLCSLFSVSVRAQSQRRLKSRPMTAVTLVILRWFLFFFFFFFGRCDSRQFRRSDPSLPHTLPQTSTVTFGASPVSVPSRKKNLQKMILISCLTFSHSSSPSPPPGGSII